VSGAVIHFTQSEHRRVQEALPWFLTGTLDEDERSLVEQHLAGCAGCRADLEEQRVLRAGLRTQEAMPDEAPALARLLERLDAAGAAADHRSARPRWPIGRWFGAVAALPRWASVTLALQCIVLAGLAWSMWPVDRTAASFHTLAAAGSAFDARGNLVVVFDPDARVRDVQAVLAGSRARVVDGPLASGAYILDAPPAGLAATIQWLRKQRAVTLAEPLVTQDGR